MSYKPPGQDRSAKLKGLSHTAAIEYLHLAEAEDWHREMADLLNKTKELRRETDLLARRNDDSQRQISELVSKLQNLPPPPIPYNTRPVDENERIGEGEDGEMSEDEDEGISEKQKQKILEEVANMKINEGVELQILPTALSPPLPPSSPVEDIPPPELRVYLPQDIPVKNPTTPPPPQSSRKSPLPREKKKARKPRLVKVPTEVSQQTQAPLAKQEKGVERKNMQVETNDKLIWDRIIKEINENKAEVRRWFKSNPIDSDVGYHNNPTAIYFWAKMRGELDKNKDQITLLWPPTEEGKPGHVLKKIG